MGSGFGFNAQLDTAELLNSAIDSPCSDCGRFQPLQGTATARATPDGQFGNPRREPPPESVTVGGCFLAVENRQHTGLDR
jgi:hypothetical protein